jgi:hypothetical protein
MVLLRKKKEAIEVRDFRPISLIHSFGKVVAKVLFARLAPFMTRLVALNQSVFIKGRAIHDNFRAVHLAAKLLHAHRCSTVLLKVGIAKAFNSVSWPFVIDLL